MCDSIEDGGRRCDCRADRNTFNRRINNRAYRRDLVAEMSNRGDPALSEMLRSVSFTAIPDVLSEAGIDPRTVSRAHMPDKTKRHALTEHDEAVLAEAAKLREHQDEAEHHLDKTYGFPQFRSPEFARFEVDRLYGGSGEKRATEQMRTDHAIREMIEDAHRNGEPDGASTRVRTATAMRYADLFNRDGPGASSVDRNQMVTDAEYMADRPEVLREMRSDELAQAWQNFAGRTDEHQTRAIDFLADEGALRNALATGDHPHMPVSSDGVVLSRVSDDNLRHRAEELRGSRSGDKALVDQEMHRRGMRPGMSYRQLTAVDSFKRFEGSRDAAHAQQHHSKEYRDADDHTRWQAYEAVFPRDVNGHPHAVSGQDKLSPMADNVQREFWEKSLEAEDRERKGKQSPVVELPPEAESVDFWVDEYRDVVIRQGVTTKAEYVKAQRAGQIAPLNRQQRVEAWKVISQFTGRSRFYGRATPEAVKALNDHVKASANATDPEPEKAN